jgi:hypothetical protein
VRFLDAQDLGPHGYRFSWSEKNGIAYTCRGGHIDVAHVRKAIDWTGFLAAVTLEQFQKSETRFRFKLHEPSVYLVTLTYPADWSELPMTERERIAREISPRLGQYFAFTALTWHEILTWFGYRPKAFESEFPSAFSWEDTYSNLLGTRIAVSALRDRQHVFNEAVTLALERELADLGAQPATVARQAAEAMRGRWFSRHWLSTTITKRNLDVGLDDGLVTPCLIDGLPDCEGASPRPLAVPDVDFLAGYGFSVRVEIEPRVWEEARILRVVYPDGGHRTKRLDPEVHFAQIINHIERQIDGLTGQVVGLVGP